MREQIKVWALWAGRLPPIGWLFLVYYRAAAWFLRISLPPVEAVLLRGSYVSGQLVPGLSDLDSEVLLAPQPDMTEASASIHRRYALVQRFFPFVQDPFVRTRAEFELCRRFQHEWLLYSHWSCLSGEGPPAPLPDQPLPLLRLALRELTKNLPHCFYAAPPNGRLAQARLNPDRLDILKRLCAALAIESPYLGELTEMRLHLQRNHYLTRQPRLYLARAQVAYLRVLEAVARPLVGFSCTVPERLLSSGGCRYHQGKLYLLADGCSDQQLVDRLLDEVSGWRPPAPEWSLSYPEPILFSSRLLPLAHLSFASSFEAGVLQAQGYQLPQPYWLPTLYRELADGIYLLRKKLPQRQRFLCYLQDYVVGVYPALALALDHGVRAATPEQAAQLYQDHYDDRYAGLLADWSKDLRAQSRQRLEEKPLVWLAFLEAFHQDLLRRHAA